MDRITKGLVDNFRKQHQLTVEDASEIFEFFCIYSVMANLIEDLFQIEDILVGSGGDTGIDGIAIIVNGRLVNDITEVDDLFTINGRIEASFVFIQAKTSASFDSGDVMKFLFGVQDFFEENPSLPRNDSVENKARIGRHIIDNFSSKMRRNPIADLYYVTTGNWNNPTEIRSVIDSNVEALKATNLFSTIDFHPQGASEIQSLYRSAQTTVVAEIEFDRKVTLPEINGVEQAYIGILPISEYLKLITDENGVIRKSVFYDNVRDFQGENDVNKEIAETLQSPEASKFAVLNNGVTIVAKEIRSIGDKYTLRDYQIINGCQTSHVIYNEMHDKEVEVQRTIFVPVKIASVGTEEIIVQAIKSTNNQTQVKPEQLLALSSFHKKLEDYYNSFDQEDRLYYERRSRQYASLPVEKTRIVSVSNQLRAFVSMFLQRPNRAWGYSGSLWREAEENAFLDSHNPILYYVSALALYRLDYMFRNEQLDRKLRRFRYLMLMIFRSQVCGHTLPNLTSRQAVRQCDQLLEILTDTNVCFDHLKETLTVIDNFEADIEADRDIVKNQSFIDKVKAYLALPKS